MTIKKRVVSTTAAAATALAGLAVVQSAGAATVEVNGELCTVTFTQADADYLNVAAEAIYEIEAPKREANEDFRSDFYAREVEPGYSVVNRVGDAVSFVEWYQYWGVDRGLFNDVDRATQLAENGALRANPSNYSVNEALLLASWEQNGSTRSWLLQHEIHKACAAGIDTETATPEDPAFSPDKFPKWDTGEDTETSTPATETEVPETTAQEPEPTDETSAPEPSEETTKTEEPTEAPKETVVVTTTVNGTPTTITSTVTKEPAPETETTTVTEPVETTTQAPEPTEETSSSEGSSEAGLPLALIAGLVAIIAAVVPFALPQIQAFLNL